MLMTSIAGQGGITPQIIVDLIDGVAEIEVTAVDIDTTLSYGSCSICCVPHSDGVYGVYGPVYNIDWLVISIVFLHLDDYMVHFTVRHARFRYSRINQA